MSQDMLDQLLQEVWECGDWDGDQSEFGKTWCPVVIYEDDEEYGDIAGYYIAVALSDGTRTMLTMHNESSMDACLEGWADEYTAWVREEDYIYGA